MPSLPRSCRPTLLTSTLLTSTLLTSAILLPVAPAVAQSGAPATPTQLAPLAVVDQAPRPMESTSVITAEQIDADQPQTMKQLFQNDPSVAVAGGSIASQKFYVNGIDQAKLNVTVDGAPQQTTIWHHNGNLMLDPQFLKGVEIDAGVAPADVGPGALGGSVRFETKDAKDLLKEGRTAGATLITGFDSNSRTVRATGAGYATAAGFDVLAIGTKAKGKNYSNGHGNSELGTGTDMTSGLAKLGYESVTGHRIEVSGETTTDEGQRRVRPNMGFVRNNALNKNTATRTTLTARYETSRPTDLFDPEVLLTYSQNTLERPNENNFTTPQTDFNSDVETVSGKIANTFAIPAGGLTVGVDFYDTRAHVDRFHFSTDTDEKITNLGAFAQARIKPTERLNVSTGLRVDHQSYDSVDKKSLENTGLSPNISAEYALTPSLTAFGGYNYVFGGIEMAEQGLYHARNYTYSDDLDPTTSHNVRAGMRFSENGLKLEGALFRTLISNPQAWDFNTSTRVNGQNLRTQGFDLSASYDWDHAGIGARFSHADVQYGGRIALPSDYNASTTIGDMLSLDGHYSFEDIRITTGATADFAFAVRDKALAANGYQPYKAYQVVNLFAEWQPLQDTPDWTLRAEINNLFDTAYISRGTYGQTATVTPVYSEGRSLYLNSTLKF